MTAVDAGYSFHELEEHIQDGIIYDVMTKLEISKREAVDRLQGQAFEYVAKIEYNL